MFFDFVISTVLVNIQFMCDEPTLVFWLLVCTVSQRFSAVFYWFSIGLF